MSGDRDTVRKGRRGFLRGLAAGGAAAVAAGGVASAGVREETGETDERAAPGPAEPRGYRMTPHIETYYRKARI